MIIELGDVSRTADGAGLSAAVRWEQAERDPVELSIHTSAPDALVLRAEAFLPACAVIAQLVGERRVCANLPVSPRFREALPTALAWTRHLSRSDRPPLELELDSDPEPPPRRPPRHAQFFSGGVDSMATLRRNHDIAPLGHPHRITELLYVHDFEEESSLVARDGVRAVAAEVGVGVIEVITNLAALDTPDRRFWQEFFYGAYLASVAQAHAGRFTRVTVAPSSGTIGPPKRVGSLPQLDTNFSSDALEIGHPHFETTRDDRIAMIADWEPARRWLRPCSKQAAHGLNCGVCEKCIPTRVAIVAAGYDLRDFACFGGTDLDAEELRRFRAFDPEIVQTMATVHGPRLRSLGRTDLDAAVTALHDDFTSWATWRARAIEEVVAAVPAGAGLQVVDLGQFSLPDPLDGRELHPHWSVAGPGEEGAHELRRAIEHGRNAGARHLAVFSSAFWWFDSYPWLGDMLDELGTPVVATDRVRVLELT